MHILDRLIMGDSGRPVTWNWCDAGTAWPLLLVGRGGLRWRLCALCEGCNHQHLHLSIKLQSEFMRQNINSRSVSQFVSSRNIEGSCLDLVGPHTPFRNFQSFNGPPVRWGLLGFMSAFVLVLLLLLRLLQTSTASSRWQCSPRTSTASQKICQIEICQKERQKTCKKECQNNYSIHARNFVRLKCHGGVTRSKVFFNTR